MTMNIKVCCLVVAAAIFNSLGVQAQDTVKVDNPTITDEVVNVAFRKVNRKELPGGISTVNVTELLKKSYGVSSLDNLQSLVPGYVGAGQSFFNSSAGTIWGQEALLLIDGIPRQIGDVRLTEVETITVLKGANAVVLYGSTASKGVILITTKRGTIKPLAIDVRANTGYFVPKTYPTYLRSADYMTLYNEASRNDGIAERYSANQIDSTRSGVNRYKYPDIDFYSSDYLKKAFNRSDITTEISGGNDQARYYTNIGLSGNNTIMKLGDQKNNKDLAFNVRGNVDMNISKWLSASADVAMNVSNNYAGRGNFFGTSNTLRPNWLTPLLPIDLMDTATNLANRTIVENSNHIIDGKYLLGGVTTDQTNAFGDALASGYIKRRYRTFLYNITAKADLSSIVRGLSFKTGYSMDYRSLYSEAYQVAYATYEPVWANVNGRDVIASLKKYGVDGNSTSESIGQTTYEQTTAFRSQFDFDRSIGNDHNINASLLGWWYVIQSSSDPNNEGGSDYHPLRNTNLGLQLGYNFRRKYYVDFSSAMVHSAKLPKGNRNALSPTVTLGWRLSDENFMKSASAIVDNLRISGSYSSINQDLDITGFRPNGTTPTDYYLYAGYYGNDGNLGGYYQWRDATAGGFTTLSGRGANPNLGFITRKEVRVGFEASLLKRLFTLEANYFANKTNGLLTRGATLFPAYFTSNGDFRPYLNYNNDKRSGVDFALNVNQKIGEFNLSVGVNGMFFSSKATRRDEIYSDAYQYRAGQPLDANWGLISEGFFQDQNEINSSARQTFGGTLKPGDLKYKDVNGDGIIDNRDQVNLGHSGFGVSPFTYGINLTLNYKHFTLFALGNGQNGAVGFKNSSNYWVRGTSVFTDAVWNRWTEATKTTADYPRLTTTAGNNNYQNSTFWMYKTNRFNLTRVQLTYDFTGKIVTSSFVHGLSLYVLGDNLLVVSKERKLMETSIGSAPQYRFFNVGVKAAF
jgi:TonB-linked SusC/RagA family outer membrane protein